MKTLEQRIKAAEAKSDRARKASMRLKEEYERKTVLPKMKKMVGKCYKYRNTYSSGDGWWLYSKITRVSESHGFHLVSVQKNGYGYIQIEQETRNSYGRPKMMEGYIEITPKEYHAAVDPILAAVRDLVG